MMTPEQILAAVPTLSYLRADFYDQCDQHRDVLLPAFVEMAATDQGLARRNAALVLVHWGQAAGSAALRSMVSAHPDEAVQTLLELAGRLPLPPAGSKLNAAESASWLALLTPLLADSTLARHALEVVARLEGQTAGAVLAATMRDAPYALQTRSCFLLAARGEDYGALAWAAEQLAMPFTADKDSGWYWIVAGLDRYCRHPDFASRAAAVVAAMVLQYAEHDNFRVGGFVNTGLGALISAGYPDTAAVAQHVLAVAPGEYQRATALRILAQVAAEQAHPYIEAALARGENNRRVVEAILAAPREMATVVPALVAACLREQDSAVLGSLVRGVLGVAPDALPQIAGVADRLTIGDRATLRWGLEGFTVARVAERLVTAGIMPMPSAARLAEVSAAWQRYPDAPNVIMALLYEAQRMVWVDSESGEIPPAYITLVETLLGLVHPPLAVEGVSQSGEGDTLVVQWRVGQRVYQFSPLDLGEWYDGESPRKALNQMLEREGRAEQFVILPTYDQQLAFACVPMSAFGEVMAGLHLPLEAWLRAG